MSEAQPNGLVLLAQQIRAVPEQAAIGDFTDQLNMISVALDTCSADLATITATLAAVRSFLERPDALDSLVARKMQPVRRGASRIAQTLGLHTPPDRNKMSSNVQDIRQGCKAAKDVVAEHWASLREKHVEKYRELVDVARAYDEVSAGRLEEELARFVAQSSAVPSSEEGARSIQSALKTLARAGASLQIEGRASQLLSSAVQGGGDLRLLRDSAVLQFLDDHPALWERLKVVFK